jgi:transposase InsO family protein
VALDITDRKRWFVSESSVYRILKSAGLVVSPAFAVQSAAERFGHPTTRINELWQTDFTYLKISGWGWYYLSTVMDDYSRMILAWALCSSMSAEDVKATLDQAIGFTGVDETPASVRPRLLSDNGSRSMAPTLLHDVRGGQIGRRTTRQLPVGLLSDDRLAALDGNGNQIGSEVAKNLRGIQY